MFKNFLICWDVESTSNKPTEDDIISIGATLLDRPNKEFQIVSEFHTYVDTHKTISPAAQAVHHISKQDLIGQPHFPEAIQKFVTWIQNSVQTAIGTHGEIGRTILLSHNGSRFDDIMLFCNFVTNRMNFDQFLHDISCYGFIDSLKMLRAMYKNCTENLPYDKTGQKVSFALGNCYFSWCGKKDLENAHNALADSHALYEILNAPCNRERLSIDHLIQTYTIKTNRAVKTIKQSAGMAFQRREEQIKSAETVSITLTEPNVNQQPLIQSSEQYSENHPKRLCLNCMNFVIVHQHTMCSTPPKQTFLS